MHEPQTKLHGKNGKIHGVFAEFDIRESITVSVIEHTCNNILLAVCQPDRVLRMEIIWLTVQFHVEQCSINALKNMLFPFYLYNAS